MRFLRLPSVRMALKSVIRTLKSLMLSGKAEVLPTPTGRALRHPSQTRAPPGPELTAKCPNAQRMAEGQFVGPLAVPLFGPCTPYSSWHAWDRRWPKSNGRGS